MTKHLKCIGIKIMSKLYCAYDHSFPKREIADHKCDICDKLLCHICGYFEEGVDYCNECWEIKSKPTAMEEIEKELSIIFEHNGWNYAELFLKSRGFNSKEIEAIHEKLIEGKSLSK